MDSGSGEVTCHITLLQGLHEGGITSCCFCPVLLKLPNAYALIQLLCLTSYDGSVSLLDVATGERLRYHKPHDNWINNACFSPDGKTLCLASKDGSASLIDTLSGKSRCLAGRRYSADTLFHRPPRAEHGAVLDCCYSTDGKLVCLATAGGTAALYTTSTGFYRDLELEHRGSINSCCFSPDGKTLCLGWFDGTATLVDTESGKSERRLKNLHTMVIGGCCYSADGTTLCLVSKDKTASLVDAATGERRANGLLHDLHDDHIMSCCFSADSTRLCLASSDKTASLILLRSGIRAEFIRELSKGYKMLKCAVLGQEILPEIYDSVLQQYKDTNRLDLRDKTSFELLSKEGLGELMEHCSYAEAIFTGREDIQKTFIKVDNVHDQEIRSCCFSGKSGTGGRRLLCLASADGSASYINRRFVQRTEGHAPPEEPRHARNHVLRVQSRQYGGMSCVKRSLRFCG